jgi:hypothetical protein
MKNTIDDATLEEWEAVMSEIYKVSSKSGPKSMMFYGTKDEFRNFKRFLGQFAADNIKKD